MRVADGLPRTEDKTRKSTKVGGVVPGRDNCTCALIAHLRLFEHVRYLATQQMYQIYGNHKVMQANRNGLVQKEAGKNL
jgi:hypothetical protein